MNLNTIISPGSPEMPKVKSPKGIPKPSYSISLNNSGGTQANQINRAPNMNVSDGNRMPSISSMSKVSSHFSDTLLAVGAPAILGATLGMGGGYIIDEEDQMRNALLGGAAGLVGGAALGRYMARGLVGAEEVAKATAKASDAVKTNESLSGGLKSILNDSYASAPPSLAEAESAIRNLFV